MSRSPREKLLTTSVLEARSSNTRRANMDWDCFTEFRLRLTV